MASSWIVLLGAGDIGCDECRAAYRIVKGWGLTHECYVRRGLVGAHAGVVIGIAEDNSGVIVRSACSTEYLVVGFRRDLRWEWWERGWQSGDVRQYLELMALAGRSPEQVWLDWQYTLGRTVRD